MAVVPEKSLDRYELLDRIAVGGMAEVFRAKAFGAHGFEKTLAIKRILPELAKEPEFEARFIAEAKLAVELSHANIVQVMDFGRFGGSLFIAMEYVSGLDMAGLLKRYKTRGERVPIPAAFHIAIQMARGLDFAHQHNVVHRDVSPSNILLSRAGEVKIADFGIAFAAGPRRPQKGKRRIMGKWRYMSPEQTQGEELGTASDLFSAAAVMYELFTGEKLFKGDESDQIIDNIHNMVIPKASEIRTGLPPRLDEVLAEALQRDPKARPTRAADIQRALTEISYSSSIVATDLDVVDTVARVVKPSELETSSPGRRAVGIDDLIRNQLGGEAGEARRTAIEEADAADPNDVPKVDNTDLGDDDSMDDRPATMVRKGVDPHGLTLWEYESEPAPDSQTIAAVPSAIRKQSGEFPILPEEDKSESSGGWGLTWLLLGVAAVTLSVAGWAAFGRGGGSSNKAAAPPIDARIAVVSAFDAGRADAQPRDMGMLQADSVPQGAKVWVDGVLIAKPTPTTIRVPAGVHKVEIEADGYRRWTDPKVRTTAGVTMRVSPTLVATKATLKVITVPPGATVKLDGKLLGTSPIERIVAPRMGATILIEKKSFHPMSFKIDLKDRDRLVIPKTLRSSIVYGTIQVHVDSWAYIYLGSKKQGTAPIKSLRLPLGRHRLRLYNSAAKREEFLWVTVVSNKANYYHVKM